MIAESKRNKAIKAIHDLIIRARILTFEEVPKSVMLDFIDYLEYLPALMLEEKDRTDAFERYLDETCKKFKCAYIFESYIKKP